MIGEREVSEELIRDLVQCVQAARDGVEGNSLFALQCDLVLARASREVEGILIPRTVEQPSGNLWSSPSNYVHSLALES
jgi:hypothetical protein